ncbi:MAG: DsbE family thiol:disulfide interchange protein [Burkholderiaceae bacterium]
MTKWLRLGLPLIILLVLAVFLAIGLQKDPRKLPSALQGKPAPAFNLPSLDASAPPFDPEKMKGKVWVMNVFASWCSACVIEHPRLIKLIEDKRVHLVGLAYKDIPEETRRWLDQHGNPYAHIALDVKGNVGIDYGVYGVPETYVIDAQGIIRVRHTGPITNAFIEQEILPLLHSSTQDAN